MRFDKVWDCFGKTAASAADSGFWYLQEETEFFTWLYSFGELNAGNKWLGIKTGFRNLSGAEYVITDNPAAFFLQGRQIKTKQSVTPAD